MFDNLVAREVYLLDHSSTLSQIDIFYENLITDDHTGCTFNLLAGVCRLRSGDKANGATSTPDGPRPVPADDGLAHKLLLPRVVPRRQVRHLGTLGAAGRADGRRLVCAQHVRAG